MDSCDYKILSGSSMWERHQAAGEELSGDYMTAFYPLEVHAKNGDSYVIAVELDADEKDVYYIKNAPIKGHILPIPADLLPIIGGQIFLKLLPSSLDDITGI